MCRLKIIAWWLILLAVFVRLMVKLLVERSPG
jgi:hypothetical protein